MKLPQLQKKPELKSCHDVTWEDNYSWIHQKDILDVLKDKEKLNTEVRHYLEQENQYTDQQLSDTKKAKYCDHIIVNEKNIKILKRNLLDIFKRYE